MSTRAAAARAIAVRGAVACVLAAVALGTARPRPLAGQALGEVCAALGTLHVGQWAEYSIQVPGAGEVGGFRFAIVGTEVRDGAELFWFETYFAQGHDESVTQLLVPGYPYESAGISAGRMRVGADEPTEMSQQMLGSLRNASAENASTPIARACAGGAAQGMEPVAVPAGELRALRVRGDAGELWLSGELPFRLVKLATTDGAEIVLAQHGTDGESWLR